MTGDIMFDYVQGWCGVGAGGHCLSLWVFFQAVFVNIQVILAVFRDCLAVGFHVSVV